MWEWGSSPKKTDVPTIVLQELELKQALSQKPGFLLPVG
jgi:hypothetical protein